jgi:hypothetical protein
MFKKIKKLILAVSLVAVGFILAITLTTNAAGTLASESIGYDNTNSGSTKTTVKEALDELYEKATTLQDSTEFEIGDYVSMTPTSTSFRISTTLTGYDSNQIINPSELNLWRVIRINEDNTVDMVSEYVSSTTVYFTGATGYRNGVGTLNLIASQYENEKYTVGSRYMGYNGQTEFIAYSLTISNSGTATTSDSTTAEKEVKGSGDEWSNIDKNLVETATGSLTAYKVGTTTSTAYWLASRKYFYVSSTDCNWSLRGVNTSGSVNLYLYSGSYTNNSRCRSLRPIVTLKSGIKATGSGTSEDPYVLN